jgi:hypothetical protein
MRKLKEAEEDIPKGVGIPELAPVSTGTWRSISICITSKKR